jgi:hypothetical protein
MKPELHSLGRRSFLMQSGWMMGGLTVAGAWPKSLLAASPSACRLVDASRYPDTCGDWTVDHVCSHWPPYACDTGPARPHTLPQGAATAGADWHWVS